MRPPTPLTLSPADAGALPSPDEILRRERGQAWVRVAVCTVIAGYLFVSSQPAGWVPTWLGVYLAVAVLFAFRISYSTRSFWIRRLLANLGDVATITYLMVVTGHIGIPLFVLYLWVTLGNGFRFGAQALMTSALLSVIGFLAVIAMSQVWQDNPRFSVGVFAALLLLPIAAANLIRRLTSGKRSGLAEKSPHADLRNRFSKTIRRRFPRSEDVLLRRERGQAMLRVVVTLIATLSVVGASWPVDVTEIPPWFVLGISYVLLALVVLYFVFRSTYSPSWRRYAANACDVTVISGGLYATGAMGMPLFALYLWVTLGVGFRFGVQPLLVSGGLSAGALSGVYLISPTWQANPTFFVGAISALVLSTLVRSLLGV